MSRGREGGREGERREGGVGEGPTGSEYSGGGREWGEGVERRREED